MAMKPIILITALVVVLAATQAQAQRLFPPITLPPLPNGTVRTLNISGVVFCSVNASVNGTNPPFPNATVELVCGGVVVASNTTNATGAFRIAVNQAIVSLATILSNCFLRVPTPLSNCNATLPSNRTLQGPLLFTGSTLAGVLNFIGGQLTVR